MAVDSFIPSNYTIEPLSGMVSWQAPSNIALVKYWGKYGEQLPTNPSISFTLKNSHTRTALKFAPKKTSAEKTSTKYDFQVFLDGKRERSFEPKIRSFFERIEKYIPFLTHFEFRIETANSFPHSSGIASSASGMSALALCLVDLEKQIRSPKTVGLPLGEADILKASFLARLGSGSACRSLEGPVIVWGKHPKIEGSNDLYGTKYPYSVHPIFENFQDTILLVDKGEKLVSSSVGHGLMRDHPFAEQRFRQANQNLSKLIPVLQDGNLSEFIKIVESEALSLHAMMLTSMPYFILMKPNTLEIINKIWAFRRESGSNACFTLDAGANVHLLYPQSEAQAVTKFINDELVQFCKNGEFIYDGMGQGAEKRE